jgi:hypothetical protein
MTIPNATISFGSQVRKNTIYIPKSTFPLQLLQHIHYEGLRNPLSLLERLETLYEVAKIVRGITGRRGWCFSSLFYRRAGVGVGFITGI